MAWVVWMCVHIESNYAEMLTVQYKQSLDFFSILFLLQKVSYAYIYIYGRKFWQPQWSFNMICIGVISCSNCCTHGPMLPHKCSYMYRCAEVVSVRK